MTRLLHPLALLGLSAILLLTAAFAVAQELQVPSPQGGEPPQVPGEEDMTVQPRGPIHEAFAMPSNAPPQLGPVVPKKPPDPIPEAPPDQRPEGDKVQWIPGYWAWDAERGDFLWVSGLWRVPPPGRAWMPGAWHSVDGGHQWSPGFWAPADQEQMPFLPQPPTSLDNGPNGPPPDDNSFYVPGSWVYRSSRYLWQPGYWQAYRPNMIWMPASYLRTPGGHLFVPGYWDWPLADRGLLFAPVFFNRPLWNRRGWSYRPNYCVPYNGLLSSLYLGPNGHGFYYGNYYGPSYRRIGFQPWFANGGCNPLFDWYRWRNLNNPAWITNLRAAYRSRPDGSLRMVQPLSQLNGVRLARLNAEQMAQQRNLAQRFQELGAQRQAWRGSERSLPLAHAPALAPATSAHAARVPAIAPPHAPHIHAAPHVPASPHITPPHPMPAHSPALVHQSAPAVHHSAPAHHPAPAAHHSASAHHGGGGHGGGHGGHHH